MSKQADYTRALELAKSGDLEQAQALLLTIDHPKAAALLEKVNKAIAARGATAKAVAEGMRQDEQRIIQRNAGYLQKGCLWYFIIAGACVLTLVILANMPK